MDFIAGLFCDLFVKFVKLACMCPGLSQLFCNKSARAKSSFGICVDNRKFCTFCNTSFAYLMMS